MRIGYGESSGAKSRMPDVNIEFLIFPPSVSQDIATLRTRNTTFFKPLKGGFLINAAQIQYDAVWRIVKRFLI